MKRPEYNEACKQIAHKHLYDAGQLLNIAMGMLHGGNYVEDADRVEAIRDQLAELVDLSNPPVLPG